MQWLRWDEREKWWMIACLMFKADDPMEETMVEYNILQVRSIKGLFYIYIRNGTGEELRNEQSLIEGAKLQKGGGQKWISQRKYLK